VKKTTIGIAALGLMLAACGGSGAVVATVNGIDVTVSDVEELYAGSSGAVPTEQFADNLLNSIVELIVIQVAESEFGITFTPDEIEARRAELEAQVVAESGGLSYEEFLENNGFTDRRIYRIAHQQLVADAVETALVTRSDAISDEDLQAAYEASRFDLTEACVSHILVDTEEEAIAAKDRIDGGETFAEVAMDVGTDGTAAAGGELGCGPLSRYVPEFALGALEVPLDQASRPVRSQFGYHLILVTERTTVPFEEAEADVRASIELQRRGSLVQEWLLEVVTEADVTIDERYGTWVTDPFPDVQPPT
jgi:parvulin-like peptidyl-prolyl isomerase